MSPKNKQQQYEVLLENIAKAIIQVVGWRSLDKLRLDRYRHYLNHHTYGVDANITAVELPKVLPVDAEYTLLLNNLPLLEYHTDFGSYNMTVGTFIKTYKKIFATLRKKHYDNL